MTSAGPDVRGPCGIAEARQLRIEERAGRVVVIDAAADQKLGDDRRDARRLLQPIDAVRVVRLKAPALVGSSVKG